MGRQHPDPQQRDHHPGRVGGRRHLVLPGQRPQHRSGGHQHRHRPQWQWERSKLWHFCLGPQRAYRPHHLRRRQPDRHRRRYGIGELRYLHGQPHCPERHRERHWRRCERHRRRWRRRQLWHLCIQRRHHLWRRCDRHRRHRERHQRRWRRRQLWHLCRQRSHHLRRRCERHRRR